MRSCVANVSPVAQAANCQLRRREQAGSRLASGDSDIHGDPEGEDDLSDPRAGADPSMNLDAIAPCDPMIERSESETPSTTPTKVQDLLKKHQAKNPDAKPKG